MNSNIKSILLVEDDPRDVELTLAGLAEYNLANKVVVVHDGEEALDYLFLRGNYSSRPAGNPVVILLDIKMPKITGLEVLKTIKGNEQLKRIPVVMLSSSSRTPDVLDSYQYGTNAYVVKPVDFTDFMQAIKQLGLFWAAVNEPPPESPQKEPVSPE